MSVLFLIVNQKHRRATTTFIVIATSVAVMSCVKRRSAAAVTGASVSGYAASESGTPIVGADVLTEGGLAPLGKTDAQGHFNVPLPETSLQALNYGTNAARKSWAIYIRQANTLGGVSPQIPMGLRGRFDSGVITVKPLASFTGRVVKANGNLITPAAGAKVFIGPDQATASDDGSFTIPGAITGTLSAVAQLDKYERTFDTIDIPAIPAINRDEPLVLFNTKLATAVLIPRLSASTQELDGSRTTRSFTVKSTPAAKYIRYYHDIAEIQKVTAVPSQITGKETSGAIATISTWREIPATVDYAFPAAGPVSLWFQVSDKSGGDRSDVMQATINVNSCDAFKGISINGGSPLTRTRRTSVSLNGLPNNVTRIRLAEDQSTLSNKPWLAVAPNLDYILATNTQGQGQGQSMASMLGGGGGGGGGGDQTNNASRQIFAELDTSTGTCPVVSATIQLQAFPDNGTMFVINGGAAVSPSKIVMINIPQLPPNAFEMRLTELTPQQSQGQGFGNNGSQVLWQRAHPQQVFFFRDTGARLLGLEFRDADGLTSPTYTAAINVIQDQFAGFNLSFAQINPLVPIVPPPPSRYLAMQLIPPQNAIAFRYMELITDGANSNLGTNASAGGGVILANYCQYQDQSNIVERAWLNLVPFLPVYACGIGLRQYMVQYLGVDGVITTTTNTITIAPVPETLGAFVINNGDQMTLFPTVRLSILPPVSAIAMSATNLSLQQTTANTSAVFLFGFNGGASGTISTNDQWLFPVPYLEFKLDSRGMQTIQIRFRDPNGNIFTPSVVSSIFYDPFPHFPAGIEPIVINGGAPSTTSPLVSLHVIAPESAYAYRASIDPSFAGTTEWLGIPSATKIAIPGVPWKTYQFDAPFIITGSAGPKIIYVQFRNELGDRSEAEIAVINYQP